MYTHREERLLSHADNVIDLAGTGGTGTDVASVGFVTGGVATVVCESAVCESVTCKSSVAFGSVAHDSPDAAHGADESGLSGVSDASPSSPFGERSVVFSAEGTSSCPQLEQVFESSGFVAPQAGHFITTSLIHTFIQRSNQDWFCLEFTHVVCKILVAINILETIA